MPVAMVHWLSMLLGMVGVSNAEFSAQTFLASTVPCNSTLTTHVPVTCRGKVFDKAKLDVWAKNLDFEFGHLSKQDWQALVKQYTAPWASSRILGGTTELFDGFNETKNYNLLDFLPIAVRGLVDHTFAQEEEYLPKGLPMPPNPPAAPKVYPKGILVPNCWTTVYEFLRSVTSALGDQDKLFHDVYSTDDKDAQAWLQNMTWRIPGGIAARRRFGDIAFIFLRDKAFQRPVLEHAVVFLDQDIVFEKAGTGELNPYRLTDLATVQKEWAPTEQHGLFSWEFHRPKFDTEQLKPFADEFSLSAQPVDSRWPEFWSWPEDLKQQYSLATADNPRNTSQIDGFTLLKGRRYGFCKSSSRTGGWEVCSKEAARKPRLEPYFVV
eukprot:TRINITY_DN22437_c0_g1_i1.p1 TRINITY_DN22437_c0_g1~~TRINITY_DN22437_c0_g1_i1.p1  ORF type:complete len:404 (+),score=57.12 TRINITY_DN22437_c0_g1_i1:74-1213(+)